MGRPPKNPSHVLVRLREAISTEQLTVTRKILGERVGISPATIRDIENGRFRLTDAIAQRIMLATGVSTRSLLNEEDPLKDCSGRILTAKSEVMDGYLDYREEVCLYAMFRAAITAAKKKKRGIIFSELFWEWLPDTIAKIDATAAMKTVLNRNLGIFDPYFVRTAFQPTDPKTKVRWNWVTRELWLLAAERADAKVGKNSNENLEAEAEAYQEILSSGELREKTSNQERKRT